MSTGPLALVVEDEPGMRRFLAAALAAHGYRLVEVGTAADAKRQARAYNPDLVLLDLALPDADGMTVLDDLRRWGKVPVIVLSARHDEEQKVRALDAGADDYLTKPFGIGELLARIRVALRHASHEAGAEEEALETGELRVDFARRRVEVRGREVHLTPLEYKLLAALARRAGKVLTHRALLSEVWGPEHVAQTAYLRVYMVQLRQKLERDAARPRYLVTETGVGYRLNVDDDRTRH